MTWSNYLFFLVLAIITAIGFIGLLVLTALVQVAGFIFTTFASGMG